MTPARRQRALQLQQRRYSLLARSRQQRDELAAAWAGLSPALHWADLGWQAWRQVRRRPWLLALPLLAWSWLKPTTLGRVASTAALLLRWWPAGSSGQPRP